ncbi:AEC family transporter [Rhodovulum sp. DZ06]|uniref:AEC family transporter n=1 Tax=Rhodovulum sp. DZ06 TaxID=3425126 RepID=UPI003D352C9D
MEVVLLVLGIVAPVFILGLAGFAWARSGTEFPTAFVTRLSFTLSVPCLIYGALAQADLDRDVLADLALGSLAAYVLACAGLWLMLKIGGLSQRTYLAPLVFGNTGNIGIPVALFAFGEQGLVYAVVIFAVMAMLSFTWGVWMVSGGGNPKEALKQPIFYGAALGLASNLTGIAPPEWAMNTIQLTGQMAIPLMLLTLGVSVARLSVAGVGRAVALSVLRLVVLTAAGLGTALLFDMDPLVTHALVLQLIMPVAVTSYLMAERYDADPVSVAGLTVVSTVIAVGVTPLALALMLGPTAGG